MQYCSSCHGKDGAAMGRSALSRPAVPPRCIITEQRFHYRQSASFRSGRHTEGRDGVGEHSLMTCVDDWTKARTRFELQLAPGSLQQIFVPGDSLVALDSLALAPSMTEELHNLPDLHRNCPPQDAIFAKSFGRVFQ